MASQEIDEALGDPWSELAQPAAAKRFRARVHRILDRLRSELSREIRLAERMIREEGKAFFLARTEKNRISPLGYYIAARRAGMPEMADRFAAAAAEQHRSCPLYQYASIPFLSADLYPAADSSPEAIPKTAAGTSKMMIMMN